MYSCPYDILAADTKMEHSYKNASMLAKYRQINKKAHMPFYPIYRFVYSYQVLDTLKPSSEHSPSKINRTLNTQISKQIEELEIVR